MVNKALLFGGLAAGATGAGVGGYFLLRNTEVPEKTIEELLDTATKGKKITKQNKAGTEKIQKWKNYIAKNTTGNKVNDNDIFGMQDWKAEQSKQTEVSDKFIEACDKQLEIKVKDNQDKRFKDYIDYCTA